MEHQEPGAKWSERYYLPAELPGCGESTGRGKLYSAVEDANTKPWETTGMSQSSQLDSLLRISDVSVAYTLPGTKVQALDHVSLDIHQNGHTIGIVGESGSGKTTLGMTTMNLIEPPGMVTGGSVDFGGKDVLRMSASDLRRYRWSQVSMVYQSAMNALNPVKRVSDPLVEVIREHAGARKPIANEQALKLLSEVGIQGDRANDYPHELSGGMRQRVIIALALALSPKLLIADEPTSALDVVVQRQILSLLKREVTERGLSLIFITHEISLLQGLVHDVAIMYAGEIVERGPTETTLARPLHPYTEMLLATLLTMGTERSIIEKRQREAPRDLQAGIPATACKYSNRCKYVFERCRNERPKLVEVEKGRWVACHKYS